MLFGNTALADAPISDNKGWLLFKTFNVEVNQDVCHIIAAPVKIKGTDKNINNQPFVMVSYIKGYNPEIHVSCGQEFLNNSSVQVIIDENFGKYALRTEGNHAKADSYETDNLIIDSMNKGLFMRIFSTSNKNALAVQDYSLEGFSNAYTTMVQTCN